MEFLWATTRSICWALVQCRAALLVPILLNVLFLTGQGSELVGSLYDETRHASAWFTFGAMMLLSFQIWFWTRLKLELDEIASINQKNSASIALRPIDQHARKIATATVPIILAFAVTASQLLHFWRTERFGLVILISVASLSMMMAAAVVIANTVVSQGSRTGRENAANHSRRGLPSSICHVLQLPNGTTDLSMPHWRAGLVFSIAVSVGGLAFALLLKSVFALLIGSIGIVILALAIYFPLLAIPRLMFRRVAIPVTAIFLTLPLAFPFVINAFSLNDLGIWPALACAAFGILGLFLSRSRYVAAGLALIVTAFLCFVSLLNYSKVSYAVTSLMADEPAQLQTTLESEIDHWIAVSQRDEKPAPYIFFVNAAGGGIRAAYWTASVLGRITDCSAQFPDRLFAISGVSGGSLGGVIYAAQLRNTLDEEGKQHVSPAAPPLCERHPLSVADVPLPVGQYQSQAKQILAHDFLTPALGNYFFRDVASAFLPLAVGQDRAVVFEHEMSNAWRAHCERAQQGGRAACEPNNLDDTSFFALRRSQQREFYLPTLLESAWHPILLLNGTHQETGKRIITSHIKITQDIFTDAYDFISGMTHADIPIAAAVLNSARFPAISPSGVIMDNNNGRVETFGHIVDGGYFENNGAATLEELIAPTMKMVNDRWPDSARRPKPVVIEILNNPDYVEQDYAIWNEVRKAFGIEVGNTTPPIDDQTPTMLSQVFGALQGLYNTSGGREVMASKSLIRTIRKQDGIFIQFRLCPNMTPSPPLGWLLTSQSQKTMDEILLGLGDREPGASGGSNAAGYLYCFNANQRSLAKVLSLLDGS